MQFDFQNKVALVTGGASGIGLATVQAFFKAGAKVAIVDCDLSRAELAARELSSSSHKALAIQCDVAAPEEVERMVSDVIKTFGKIDIAFNNAGVQNQLAETADATVEDFDSVNGVNLRGMWSCMKYELRQMREQGAGVIVNCSSLGGLVGGAERGTYHAAKHGVLGLTKSAALEYADRNIRVNAVCPGLIWTPMAEQMAESGQREALEGMISQIPMKRHGDASEIADVVLWLSSDASSYVTGQSISVDGGLIMR